eukprot:CAMPEP_0170176318 /NCGR_PEP_ID=MMETSP0040_2-20121228/9223_1 /TAXON_ID=641309 /ORGANISM="Lotharella oceanica, Strain CCMP622" /LENGTH=58 /DNA_ID=CAMNT_0010418599 /DNA_START=624 /DNA_END=797 /DNA_ORIENTATION=-
MRASSPRQYLQAQGAPQRCFRETRDCDGRKKQAASSVVLDVDAPLLVLPGTTDDAACF